MPRNMSFAYTKEQIRNQTKTVTRRLGWRFLKKGDVLNAVEKAMGLKSGEKIKVLCQIRVKTRPRREQLSLITEEEIRKEGFPGMTREEFIKKFTKANRCNERTMVTRILFEYL